MLSLFRNARLSLRRLWMEVTAVGTLEFALIVPFMALVMLGGYETANYVRMSQRVEIAANSIAEMISQIPPSSAASQTGDGLLTLDQIHFFGDSIMYMVPDALSEADRLAAADISIDMINVNDAGVFFVCDDENVRVHSTP